MPSWRASLSAGAVFITSAPGRPAAACGTCRTNAHHMLAPARARKNDDVEGGASGTKRWRAPPVAVLWCAPPICRPRPPGGLGALHCAFAARGSRESSRAGSRMHDEMTFENASVYLYFLVQAAGLFQAKSAGPWRLLCAKFRQEKEGIQTAWHRLCRARLGAPFHLSARMRMILAHESAV